MVIDYGYDPGGNRTSKRVNSNDTITTTFYVRDAQGNVMGVYSIRDEESLKWNEQHLYGSSRLGMWRWDTTVPALPPVVDEEAIYDSLLLGSRTYELSNHLGNVLATISDKKIGNDSSGVVNYYIAEVLSQNDYYPFGMQMPGRTYVATSSYKYGFNGKEMDNEVKGEGNQQDYGMRIYDPRLGKFLSADPLAKDYPWFTPYQFAGDMPIWAIDLDGLEAYFSNGVKFGYVHNSEPMGYMYKWKTLDSKPLPNLAGGWRGTQLRMLDENNNHFFVKKYERTVSIHTSYGPCAEKQYMLSYFSDAPRLKDDGGSYNDNAGWKSFKDGYTKDREQMISLANGTAGAFFGIAAVGAAIPATIFVAPTAASSVSSTARFAWQGLKSEASLFKFIPKSYLTYVKVFGANAGLQVAFNGKDADIYDAAATTINPWVAFFTNPVINYKPLSGDVVPTIGKDKPSTMTKKFLISAPFFLLGTSMQTLSPSTYETSGTDYFLNVAEEAVDNAAPDPQDPNKK